jgi:2-isopropylmalate synthase/UPF0716 protein FxsA
MRFFLFYLFIETVVSVQFASALGGLMTFLEFIVSAIIGSTILKNLNLNVRDNLQKVQQGQISQGDFTKMHITALIGAILLIIPGFFTDIIGIILQFENFSLPFVRKFIKPKNEANNSEFRATYTSYSSNNFSQDFSQKQNKTNQNEEIIDVEIIEQIEPDNSTKS